MKNPKNIPALLDDGQYFFRLFQKNLKLIDQDAVKILFHQFFYIKRHISAEFFHYVIEHRLTLEQKHGIKIRRKVYTISFSNHGREKMYQAMALAYQNGFDQGDVVVPKPLWYETEAMALFYLGIPGDSLLEHLKNGHFDLNNIKKIAQALERLHASQVPGGVFTTHDFSFPYVDPTNVLGRDYNLNDPLKSAVLTQLSRLQQLQKKVITEKNVLSHGDFHPDNIIINKFDSHQLAFIDFSEVCLSPCYYDLASFLQQLELMSLGYLDRRLYLQAEKVFLAAYFNDQKISPAIIDKINLYKAWTALKNAVYALIFTETHDRHYARYLVTLSQKLSQHIK